MKGFNFVTPVTGLNRPNTGKEDDNKFIVVMVKCGVLFEVQAEFLSAL
jgi:hypothetical protein